jgi:hypothetical protein
VGPQAARQQVRPEARLEEAACAAAPAA